jgi:hypothetical protein
VVFGSLLIAHSLMLKVSMNDYIYVKMFFFIVVVQAEVRIAVRNAVRMALFSECSPAVQEIQDSIPN